MQNRRDNRKMRRRKLYIFQINKFRKRRKLNRYNEDKLLKDIKEKNL